MKRSISLKIFQCSFEKINPIRNIYFVFLPLILLFQSCKVASYEQFTLIPKSKVEMMNKSMHKKKDPALVVIHNSDAEFENESICYVYDGEFNEEKFVGTAVDYSYSPDAEKYLEYLREKKGGSRTQMRVEKEDYYLNLNQIHMYVANDTYQKFISTKILNTNEILKIERIRMSDEAKYMGLMILFIGFVGLLLLFLIFQALANSMFNQIDSTASSIFE